MISQMLFVLFRQYVYIRQNEFDLFANKTEIKLNNTTTKLTMMIVKHI